MHLLNKRPEAKGRGSQIDPPNRFGGPVHVLDLEHVEHDEDYLAGLANPRTEYIPDRSRTIVAVDEGHHEEGCPQNAGVFADSQDRRHRYLRAGQ